MNNLLKLLVLMSLVVGNAEAFFGGNAGFYAYLAGAVDFPQIKEKGKDATTHRGTGFGVEVSPGLRFGSSINIGPFGMFTNVTDSKDSNLSYLLSGYGGELKLRLLSFNFRGGYGLYYMDVTRSSNRSTDYKEGWGWHAGGGFETLLGPGVTIFLEGKYRSIVFTKNYKAEYAGFAGTLGVATYF